MHGLLMPLMYLFNVPPVKGNIIGGCFTVNCSKDIVSFLDEKYI